MSAPKLSKDAKNLLKLVPEDGVFIGNANLQRQSKLGKRYWTVRSELLNEGVLTRGKGRGGSVARIGVIEGALAPTQLKAFVDKEAELYQPLKEWLDEVWREGVEPTDFFESCVTATPRKKKRASGQWSRPDVTLVQVNSYEYLPLPILEVTTFEVKSLRMPKVLPLFMKPPHIRGGLTSHFSWLRFRARTTNFRRDSSPSWNALRSVSYTCGRTGKGKDSGALRSVSGKRRG